MVNDYSYYPWTQQGGRLQRMTSGSPGDLTSLQKLQYSYDPVGNVLSIQDYKMGVDAQTPQSQSFAYDNLYRLTSALVTGGLNGVGDYDESTPSGLGYTYDPNTGNLTGKAGLNYTYGDPSHAHAVTSLSNGWSYVYDPNGNMTQRNLGSQVFNLAYDAENHLVQVSGTVTATFGYDGDGKRVLSAEGVTTTVYLGNYFEMSVSGGITSTIKYYYAGAERVAMRQNEGAVNWLLGDHLGSTSLVYDGSQAIRQGYKAWGERRFILSGEELPTTFRYTGQREEASIGLYYYGARWYDPALARFIQADNIVAEPYNPHAFDRYAYTYNSPIRYTDSSGNCIDGISTWICIGVVVGFALKAIDYGWTAYDIYQSTMVLDSPYSSLEDRLFAGLTIALAILFEALEPDDIFPAGLPIDDAARKVFTKEARKIYKEGGAEALIGFIRQKMGKYADEVLASMGLLEPSTNKLHNIFDKSGHFLDVLIKKFGSEKSAYNAVHTAFSRVARKYSNDELADGIYIIVRGVKIKVRGKVIDNVVYLGTFFVEAAERRVR